MAPVSNEQSRRRFVAMEAQALGRGGVSLMAQISGLARRTIYHGLSDIRDRRSSRARKGAPAWWRAQEQGSRGYNPRGGSGEYRRACDAGDPMRSLLWTCRSLRNLVKELAKKGHKVCPTVVGNPLRDMGYSLQANSKTREGSKHIDRNAQFEYINTQAKAFLTADEPVISVDTKKKDSRATSRTTVGSGVRKALLKPSTSMTSSIPS